ncbi:MAG: DUF2203 family protein [Planctomycetota bacterium]|nr:DUF2203 family protein [Planctomycetota bacterium]
MHARISRPETITAMIPLVSGIAVDIAKAYARAETFVDAEPSRALMADIDRALDEIQAYVAELERLGGTLRSYEPVRIDFLAEVEGEIGYVCYAHGDAEATHFHPAMSSCAHRRPLEASRELTTA